MAGNEGRFDSNQPNDYRGNVTRDYTPQPKKPNSNNPFNPQQDQQAHNDWNRYYGEKNKAAQLSDMEARALQQFGPTGYDVQKNFRQLVDRANQYGRDKGIGQFDENTLRESGQFSDTDIYNLTNEFKVEDGGSMKILDRVNRIRAAESSLHSLKVAKGIATPKQGNAPAQPQTTPAASQTIDPSLRPNTNPADPETGIKKPMQKENPHDASQNGASLREFLHGNTFKGVPTTTKPDTRSETTQSQTPEAKGIAKYVENSGALASAGSQAKMGKLARTLVPNQAEDFRMVHPTNPDEFAASAQAETSLPRLAQAELSRRLTQQTPPIVFDAKEQAYKIGDVDRIMKETHGYMTSVLSQYFADKGMSGEALKLATTDAIHGMLEQDGGIADYLKDVFMSGGADWRNNSMKLSDAATGDADLLSLLRSGQQHYRELRQIKAMKSVYGDTMKASDFKTTGVQDAASGRHDFYQGLLGWASADLKKAMQAVQMDAEYRETHDNKEFNSFLFSDKPDYEALSPASRLEMKRILSQYIPKEQQKEASQVFPLKEDGTPDLGWLEAASPIAGSLAGTLLGYKGYGGSLNVSSRIVGRASKMAAQMLEKSPELSSKLLASPSIAMMTKSFKILGMESKSALHSALTFGLNHVLEHTKDATQEDIERSAATGALFGFVDSFMGNKVFYPMFMRAAKWSKAYAPYAKLAGKNAEIEGMSPASQLQLTTKLNQIRDGAFKMASIVANPLQTKISADLFDDNHEIWKTWTDPQTLVDMALGPMMHKTILGDLRRMGRFKPLTMDDVNNHIEIYETSEKLKDAQATSTTSSEKPQQEDVSEATTATEQQNPSIDHDAVRKATEADQAARAETVKPIDSDQGVTGDPVESAYVPHGTVGDILAGINPDELLDTQKFGYDIIKDFAPDTPVVIDPSLTDHAEYDTDMAGLKRVRISPDLAENPNAILHEGLHGSTVHGIYTNPEALQKAVELRDAIVRTRIFRDFLLEQPAKAKYFMNNPAELLTFLQDERDGIARQLNQIGGVKGRVSAILDAVYAGHSNPNQKVIDAWKDTVRTAAETKSPQQDLEARIDKLVAMGDEQSLEEADRLQSIVDDLERSKQDLGAEHETIMGLWKDVRSVAKAQDDWDVAAQTAYDAETHRFMIKAYEMGIKDEAAIPTIVEAVKTDYPDFDDMNPFTKLKLMNDKLDHIGQHMPEVVAELRELSKYENLETLTPFDESFKSEDRYQSKHVKAILGVENAKVAQLWLSSRIKDPEKLYTEWEERVQKYADGLPIEQQDAVIEAGNRYIQDYIRNRSNRQEVKTLIASKTKGIQDVKGINRDPVSNKRIDPFIQNPTGFKERMKAMRREYVPMMDGTRAPFITPKMEDLVNFLAETGYAQFSDAEQLKKNKTVSTMEGMLKTTMASGYMPVPKGIKGNLFLDVRRVVDHMKKLRAQDPKDEKGYLLSFARQAEALPLIHFLGTERQWGWPNKMPQVNKALAYFDVWKLAGLAADGKRVTGENIGDAIRAEIRADDQNFKTHFKNIEGLIGDANQIVDKIGVYYRDGQAEIRKPTWLTHSPEHTVVAAMQTMLHSAVDYGRVNAETLKKNGKANKLAGKYWSNAIGSDYKALPTVDHADMLLKDKGYPKMNMDGMDSHVRDMNEGLWRQHGVHFDGDGTPKVKHFIVSDENVMNHPVMARLFTDAHMGDDAPASQLQDGGTFLINPLTHELYCDMFGADPRETGSVKFGYAGDHIYKSAMHRFFPTELMKQTDPEAYQFLSDLIDKGVSSIVIASSIKSKTRSFNRFEMEPGKFVVHEDDGTVLGLEEYDPSGNVNAKSWNDEEKAAYYASNPVPNHAIKSYPLVGENPLRFINKASVNNKVKAPNLGINNLLYSMPGYGGEFGQKMQDILKTPIRNVADKFSDLMAGRAYTEQARDLHMVNYLDDKAMKQSGKFLKNLADGIADIDEYSFEGFSPEKCQEIARSLRTAVSPEGKVVPETLFAIDQMYPNLFRSLDGKHSFADNFLRTKHDQAVNLNLTGKSMKLISDITAHQDYVRGLDVSADIVQKELERQYRNLPESEREQAINDGLEEYINSIEELAKEEFVEVPTGAGGTVKKLKPYGQGIVISQRALERLNQEIIRNNKKNRTNMPLLKAGSKVVYKLTPHDSIESWTARRIVGITDDPTGVYTNNKFVTTRNGRDLDGDDMGIVIDSPEWYGDGDGVGNNAFSRFWDMLAEAKTHEVESLGKQTTDASTLRDLNGQPFLKKRQQGQSHDPNFYETMLKAQGEDAIANGIGKLNNFYLYMKQTGKKLGETDNGLGALVLQYDANTLEKNDAVYKQMQYDTFEPHSVDADDIFYGSRIKTYKGTEWNKLNVQERYDAIKDFTYVVRPNKFKSEESASRALSGSNMEGSTNDPYSAIRTAYATKYQSIKNGVYTKYGRRDYGFEARVKAELSVMQDHGIVPLGDSPDPKMAAIEKNVVARVGEALHPFINANDGTGRGSTNQYRHMARTPQEIASMRPLDARLWRATMSKMLETAKVLEPGQESETPLGTWKSSMDGVTFEMGEEIIPAAMVIGPDGDFHPSIIAKAQETGQDPHSVLTPAITGRVRYQSLPPKADRQAVEKFIAENPDKIIVKATLYEKDPMESRFKNLISIQTGEKVGTKYEGLSLDKLAVKAEEAKRRIEEAMTKNPNAVVLIDTGMGFGNEAQTLLDRALPDVNTGSIISRYGFANDTDKANFQGRLIAAAAKEVAPHLGYQPETFASRLAMTKADYSSSMYPTQRVNNITGGTFLNVHAMMKDGGLDDQGEPEMVHTSKFEPAYVLDGMREAGVQPEASMGVTLDGALFEAMVDASRKNLYPDDYKEGEKTYVTPNKPITFGLYSPNQNIKAAVFGRGNASKINRLNELLGKDFRDITPEEIESSQETFKTFFREQYGEELTDETMDRLMGAFSPQYWSKMENTTYAAIRSNPYGKTQVRAHKYMTLLQALNNVHDYMDRIGMREKPTTVDELWNKFGLVKYQSAGAMVNTFATDTRIQTKDTPLHIVPTVVDGQLVDARIKSLGDTYDQNSEAPVSMDDQSDTFIRHGYTSKYLEEMLDVVKKQAASTQEASFSMRPKAGIPQEAIRQLNEFLGGNKGQEWGLMHQAVDQDGHPYQEHVPIQIPDIHVRSRYNGQGLPEVTMTIGGTTFSQHGATFKKEDLESMTQLLMPAGMSNIFGGQSEATLVDMQDMTKLVLQTMAQNHRNANIYQAAAATLEAHLNRIVEATDPADADHDPRDGVFRNNIKATEQLVRKLRQTAESLSSQNIHDHLRSMLYVPETDYLVALDQFNNLKDEEKNPVLLKMGDDLYGRDIEWQNSDEDQRLRRMRSTIGARYKDMSQRHTEMTRVQEYLDRNYGNEPPRPVLVDPTDTLLWGHLKDGSYNSRTSDVYDDHMAYKKTMDAAQRFMTEIKTTMGQLYQTERRARKQLGLPVNENPIAEDNILTMFSTDGTLYKTDHNIHGANGFKQKMSKAFMEGRQWLSDDETGIMKGAPIQVTYQDGFGDVHVTGGRFLGIVGRSQTLKEGKALKDAKQKYGSGEWEDADGSAIARLSGEYDTMRPTLVMYDDMGGKISYMDLEVVQAAQTGFKPGALSRWSEAQRTKFLNQYTVGNEPLMPFLVKNADLVLRRDLDDHGHVKETPVSKLDKYKDVKFFAEVPRDEHPTQIGRMVDRTAAVWSSFAGHWAYGFGKQATQFALGVATLPVTAMMGVPEASLMLIFNGAGGALAKLGFNSLGNAVSPFTRTLFTSPTMLDPRNMKEMSDIAEGRTIAAGSPLEATVDMRTGNKGALYGATTDVGMSRKIDTWDSNRAAKAASIVNDHYRALGTVLGPDKLQEVQQYVKEHLTNWDRLEAAIVDGRVVLKGKDSEGMELGSYSDMRNMNLNALDMVMTVAGRYAGAGATMQKALVPLIKLNKIRSQGLAMQGATEGWGIKNQAMLGELRAGAEKPSITDPNADIKTMEFIRMMIEGNLGKFDERPVHMQTPTGRVLTLFSQFSRNFSIKTTTGAMERERLMKELYDGMRDDPDFVKAVKDKYGMNLGDHILPSIYGRWDGDKYKMGNKNLAVQAGIGAAGGFSKSMVAAKWGFNAMLSGAIASMLQSEWSDKVFSLTSPIGQLIESGITALTHIWTDEEGLTKREEGKVVKETSRALSDVAQPMGLGFGMATTTEMLVLIGLYIASKTGMLPDIDDELLVDKAVRVVQPTTMPITGPLGVGLEMKREIDKKTKPKKSRKKH